MHEIVIATRNAGKAAELRTLLAPLSARVLDLTDIGVGYDSAEEAVESGETFEENALAKAQYFARRCDGRAVVADDSGLCVAALGGAPGVYSRRYSGVDGDEVIVSRANNQKLLRELVGVADRRAEFIAALAYVSHDAVLVATGTATGRILERAHGAGGFGYDALFWSDDLGVSFGEAPADDKARVSHRARAVARLLARVVGTDALCGLPAPAS